MRRPRDGADREFGGVERDRLLQGMAALERRRLLAGPGPDLREAWAGRKIGIGLGITDPRHRAPQPDLPIGRFPMKQHGGFGAAVELAALLASDVGVEDKAALVEALHQHHANVRSAIGIDGGERHGGGVARLRAACLLEPGRKQPQRLVGLCEITGR